MIYLDNAATTKPSPGTVAMAERILEAEYFNPSALYYPGVALRNEIEKTREKIADKLGCKTGEIVFTSGATEANNWVMSKGIKNKHGNIVISEGEHPSVYEPAMSVKGQGTTVRIVPLSKDGTVDGQKLLELIDADTTLVSVMHVSNETGAVNDVKSLSKSVKAINPRTLFHSDGVQAFCKTPIALGGSDIDLYSISAHKIGGLKGIGALYIKNGINLAPLIFGGGQEKNLRSGTENVMSILSFGTAISDFDDSSVPKCYECAIDLLSNADGFLINGSAEHSSRFIISVGISGVKSEILQHLLSDQGILIGTGSACSSKTKKNRTLESMKVEKKYADGNIRISFSPTSTPEETAYAIKIIIDTADKLRSKIHG